MVTSLSAHPALYQPMSQPDCFWRPAHEEVQADFRCLPDVGTLFALANFRRWGTLLDELPFRSPMVLQNAFREISMSVDTLDKLFHNELKSRFLQRFRK